MLRQSMRVSFVVLLGAIFLSAVLTGCGGGNSTPPPPPPPKVVLSPSPNAVSFGDQWVGATSSETTLTLTNTGTATATINTLTLSGANAADFRITAGTTPITVSAGGSATVKLTFTPSGEQARSANLVVTSNADGSPQTISVNGTGRKPTITPASVTFDPQLPNSSSAARTVTIGNPSTTLSLTITSIDLSGPQASEFSKSGATLPVTVAPGGNTAVNVVFTPTTADPVARAATLTITHQTGSVPVTLSGTTLVPQQDVKASAKLAPDTAKRGDTVPVTVTGNLTYFVQGATVADFGPGITLVGNSVKVDSPTQATAQVQVGPQAAPGRRTVRITTNGHSSAASFFVDATGSAASAGVEQFVPVGSTVHLDACRSSISSSGETGFTYQWSFLSTPAGSKAAISDPSALRPTFVADKQGDYVVQLAATDGAGTTLSSVMVSTTGSISSGPQARAGADQITSVGSVVILDGSASNAADGDPLMYEWEFVSKPTGSTASLINDDTVSPSFTIDTAGTYVLRLIVNDSHGNNSTDLVTVSTTSVPPRADAGPNQNAVVGAPVQLDGSKSAAMDGGALNYNWRFTSKPTGSTAALSNAHVMSPSFTIDLAGDYALQLIVTDTNGSESRPATMVVSTTANPPVAVAGNGQTVAVGSTVQLDGSASYELAHHDLSYQWSLLTKPESSVAALSGATTATPSFVADLGGFYVAQLIVSSDTFRSAPSTVMISATAPAFKADTSAIAFGDQRVGTTSGSKSVVITNTGTADLVISALALEGTNASEFAYTSAALPVTVAPRATTTVNVTFTPAASGDKSATIKIADNAFGAPHAIALSGKGTDAVFQADKTSVSFPDCLVNDTCAASVKITNAGTADLVLSSATISGLHAGDFKLTTSTPITVTPGTDTVLNLTFTPAAMGQRQATLTIDDNAPDHPHSIPLTGTGTPPATIQLDPTSLDFGSQPLSGPKTMTLNVSNSGGVSLTVSKVEITGTEAADFSYTATLPLTIAGGGSSPIGVTFTPHATGPRSATLQITDNSVGSPHSVPLTGMGTSQGQLNLVPLSVGNNLETMATVSVGTAPSAPVTVSVQSADKTKVLLSADPAQAGAETVTVTIAAGSTFANPGFYVQALAASGTVTLTATAPGYQSGTTNATLTPSAFVLQGGAGIGEDFSTGTNEDTTLKVTAYRLNADLSMAGEQKLRGGSTASVAVTSADTKVGTILASPATVSGGASSSNAMSFHPIAAGSALLSVTQPAGFSTPSAGASLTANVQGPCMLLQDVVVGSNLEVRGVGSLCASTTKDVTVTVKSSDPANILVSKDPAALGSSSVDLVVSAGTTAFPPFYVQAVGSSGQFALTASAPGYQTAATPHGVMITPSAILIAPPSGNIGESFTTTTVSPDTTLTLLVYRLDGSFNLVSSGQIRGGAQVLVTVATDNSSIGTVLNNPAILNGSDTTSSMLVFHPTGAGTAQVTVQQPSGFSPPKTGGNLTATVVLPQISLNLPLTCSPATCVGKNLEIRGTGALNVAAPIGGVQVTLTSSNPNLVLLSDTPSGLGSPSITVTVPAGKGIQGIGFPPFYVQGLQSAGSVTITATANNWASATGTVNLGPSGFVFNGPNGCGDVGTITGTDVQLFVMPALLDTSLNPLTFQAVRGSATPVSVPLTNTTPSVGSIVPPSVQFPGGSGVDQPYSALVSFNFHPLSAGTTTLGITQPMGFSTPSRCVQLNAVVK